MSNTGKWEFRMHSIKLHAILGLLACTFFLITTSACAASSSAMDKYSHRAPKKLTEVVGCLVAADFVRKYDLSYLGFEVDDWAWARYSIGTIPGLEKTPKLVHVILYAANQHRGMLLLAYPNKRGSFDAILNAYRLERHGMKWIAGYGNGGYADYRAISKYVTRLEQQPRYRVHLVPGGPNCGSFH